MVLTKAELIRSLQNEVRVFLHLTGKVEPSMLDYRPTPSQRSMLELIQYMAIMGPTQIAVIKAGSFTREAMSATWGPAEQRSKQMTFEQAVAAIAKQSDEFAQALSDWTEADFRSEVNMFGHPASRGHLLVNLVISAFAAYRTQLFCYLKLCGRHELGTLNLWAGVDTMAAG